MRTRIAQSLFVLFFCTLTVNAFEPLRCLASLRNTQAKISARNSGEADRLRSQGVLSVNDIRVGAVYWSVFAARPITIKAIDKGAKPPVVHYEYESGPKRTLKGIIPIDDDRNVFVPLGKENSYQIFGKAALATISKKPENIARLFAIAGIYRVLRNGSVGVTEATIAHNRNDPRKPESMGNINKKMAQLLEEGKVEEVDAYLDDFYKKTGIDPYKLGAYASPDNQMPTGDTPYATTNSFLFFKDTWRDILGISSGISVPQAIDHAMAELSWNTGNEKFGDKNPNRISLYPYKREDALQLKTGNLDVARTQIQNPASKDKIDFLVNTAKAKHPDKEVIFVCIPNNAKTGSSSAMRTVLGEMGHKVVAASDFTFKEDQDSSQKDLGRTGRILRYRDSGSNFRLGNTSQFNDKIVIVVDDVETTGITMDNASIHLYFRGGAAAVYGLSVYDVSR